MSGGLDSAGSFWSGCDFQSFPLDAQQHAAENEVMQRGYRIPVEQPKQAARIKQGPLQQCALAPRSMRNSMSASPGNFISARSASLLSRSNPTTRQKSSASP